MALVDTMGEQQRLEQLLDESKPPVPAECRALHYLLATPFRYGAPYPNGSRFRRAGFTPGVYYASTSVATAVSEMSFRRLLFFAESPSTPWPANAAQYTAFSVRFRSSLGLDLDVAPFDQPAGQWRHPTDYSACQELADSARAAGVAVLRYNSVRGPGRNVALLTAKAFGSREPQQWQVWRLHAGPRGVRAICSWPEQRLAFDRQAFAADPRLESMNWER